MVNHFHRFVPAMKFLPPIVTAHGLTFHANHVDGYYYARPGVQTQYGSQVEKMLNEHKIGDVRARFMCVPGGNATVVGVHCYRESDTIVGYETFVPYRTIARAPCLTEGQEKQKLVEEGDRSLKELRRELACCTGGVATCCCCPCNTIAVCCAQEVVTEEILYVSDQFDPIEKPF